MLKSTLMTTNYTMSPPPFVIRFVTYRPLLTLGAEKGGGDLDMNLDLNLNRN